MISEKTYSKTWVMDLRELLGSGKRRLNPGLIEKVTKAFHLLEELSKSNINFIFKGGTSLLLLLDKMHRLSIDIDIVIEDDIQDSDILKVLANIVSDSPVFIRVEENNHKSKNKIMKSHYKFYYLDINDTEAYVLLDIVFERSHYPKIISTEINCSLIEYNDPSGSVHRALLFPSPPAGRIWLRGCMSCLLLMKHTHMRYGNLYWVNTYLLPPLCGAVLIWCMKAMLSSSVPPFY